MYMYAPHLQFYASPFVEAIRSAIRGRRAVATGLGEKDMHHQTLV